MLVIQSNGTKERFSPNKILDKINTLSKGLNKIDTDQLSKEIINNVIDGITTKEISELSAGLSANKVSLSYDYSILASRLIMDSLYKVTPNTFIDSIEDLNSSGYLSQEYYNKILSYDLNKLESSIDYDKDFDYDFFAVGTLQSSYLMKNSKGKIAERPQHMHMRMATFLTETLEEAITLYKMLSNKLISPASPIIFNSGTKKSTLVSCNLISMLKGEDMLTNEYKAPDSLEGIHNTYLQASKLSSGAAGIGLNITPIRSRRSQLSTTNGKAAGIQKIIMKPINALMLAYDQSGKRKGAAACYIESWHLDIEDFLEVRRLTADEETACRDIFLAIWMNDLFMERLDLRVKNGKRDKSTDWTLFCPNDLLKHGYGDFQEYYGSEFKDIYEKAEQDKRLNTKVVDVIDIWSKIVASQQESGLPYITYKDRVNESNMQSNMGVIRQSNLCVAPESLLLTDSGYIPIEELKDQEVTIWNGFEWSDTIVRQTGRNQELLKVTLDDGNVIYATDYHKWSIKNSYKSDSEIKRTIDLEVGDKLTRCEFPLIKEGDEIWKGKTAYTHGFFCSDGFYRDGNPHIYLYDEKKNLLPYIEVRNKFTGSLVNRELDELAINENGNKITVGIDFNIQPKYYVPTNHTYKERLNWFEGVCDGDGCITINGSSFGLQLCSINLDYLKDIGLMLNTLGINSTISLMKEEGLTMLPDGKGGNKEYPTKTAYRLLISHYYLTKLKNIGFSPKRLCLKGMSNCTSNRNRLTKVIAVDREGRYDDTYCLTEPKRNSMVINGNMILNCNEIIQVTNEDTVANCVLSAIPIGNPLYIKNGKFDYNLLKESVYQTVKFLNILCDINKYPTKETKKGGEEQRAIAIGTMGLADLFAQLDLTFDSDEAEKLSTSISEHIYYYSLESSMLLAKEQGRTYPSFRSSDYAKGILHFDKYLGGNAKLNPNLDWNGLKENIVKHGLLNSLLCAKMPTASCFVIQTKINTDIGVRSFQEILEDGGIDWKSLEKTNDSKWMQLDSFIGIHTQNGIVRTNEVYYNGHKEVYAIEMEDGTIYEATANHRFLINKDGEHVWVRVDELNEDDDIVNVNISSMKIKSIKKNGIKPTWDVYVPNEEHYILENGCVSHNSANVQALNEADEPFTNLIYKRKVLSGEYAIANKHLIKDLEDIGFWCEDLKNEIILEESLKDIFLEKYSSSITSKVIEEKGFDYINDRIKLIKAKYKTAWELGAKPIIHLAACRQPFVDQTQSMNLWMSDPNSSKLTSMHLHGWKKGLKTGIYYLRGKAANKANKNLGIARNNKPKAISNGEIDCIGCSV